jgi:hypothetical protein
MANHLRDASKEGFWRRTLARWQRSGLTIRDYCAQNGLSEASLYAWRRTIAQRDREAAVVPAKSTRRRLAKRRSRNGSATFLPVHVVPTSPAPTSAIEVVFGNGRVLRVAAGFDARVLRQLITCLEEPSC